MADRSLPTLNRLWQTIGAKLAMVMQQPGHGLCIGSGSSQVWQSLVLINSDNKCIP
jgi:hypothetical protein